MSDNSSRFKCQEMHVNYKSYPVCNVRDAKLIYEVTMGKATTKNSIIGVAKQLRENGKKVKLIGTDRGVPVVLDVLYPTT